MITPQPQPSDADRSTLAGGSEIIGKITGWMVELEPGVWIAPWDGDPGRTLNKLSATIFPTLRAASAALDRASDFREWTAPEIVPVTTFPIEKAQTRSP